MPRRTYVALVECIKIFRKHKIRNVADYRVWRKDPANAAIVKTVPWMPTDYYGVKWADIATPVMVEGKKVVPTRRLRLTGADFLSIEDAKVLLDRLGFHCHFRSQYMRWLTAQPLAIQQQLPLNPSRHYTQKGEVFDGTAYYTRPYTFAVACAIMGNEQIYNPRRYYYALRGKAHQASGFQVSEEFDTIHRYHLPMEFDWYLGDDRAMKYQKFFHRLPDTRLLESA